MCLFSVIYLYCIILVDAVFGCVVPGEEHTALIHGKKEILPHLFDHVPYPSVGAIPMLNRKIFGGKRVSIREHPYVASIRRKVAHYSVGSIVTKNILLTVAHPLIDVSIAEFSVVIGENYADRGATLYTVILMVVHENFDRYTLANDIALLRIFEDITYKGSAKSIPLIRSTRPLEGRKAFVTGWGRCDRTGRELCLPRSTRYTEGEKFDPMLRTVSFVIKENNTACATYEREERINGSYTVLTSPYRLPEPDGVRLNFSITTARITTQVYTMLNHEADVATLIKSGVRLRAGMMCLGTARHEDPVVECMAVPGAPLVVGAQLTGMQSWGFGCGHTYDLPLVYSNTQYYKVSHVTDEASYKNITYVQMKIGGQFGVKPDMYLALIFNWLLVFWKPCDSMYQRYFTKTRIILRMRLLQKELVTDSLVKVNAIQPFRKLYEKQSPFLMAEEAYKVRYKFRELLMQHHFSKYNMSQYTTDAHILDTLKMFISRTIRMQALRSDIDEIVNMFEEHEIIGYEGRAASVFGDDIHERIKRLRRSGIYLGTERLKKIHEQLKKYTTNDPKTKKTIKWKSGFTWLVYNIKKLRSISKVYMLRLFQAKRAYVLKQWLMLTRILPPSPYVAIPQHLEPLRVDKELSKLYGTVYDIRDYLYDGIHHKYKMKLYKKMSNSYVQNMRANDVRAVIERQNITTRPFLNSYYYNQSDIVDNNATSAELIDADSDVNEEYVY